MSCRAIDTKPGCAVIGAPNGPRAGSLRVELAPSVTFGASNPGGGATLCVLAVDITGVPEATRLLVRVVIVPRRGYSPLLTPGTRLDDTAGGPQMTPAASHQAPQISVESCQRVCDSFRETMCGGNHRPYWYHWLRLTVDWKNYGRFLNSRRLHNRCHLTCSWRTSVHCGLPQGSSSGWPSGSIWSSGTGAPG